MHRPSVAIAAVTTLVVSAAFAVSSSAATKTVKIGDNFFSPKTVSVSKRSTVKWVWKGKRPHNVTVTSGPVKFTSPTQKKGTFSKKLRHLLQEAHEEGHLQDHLHDPRPSAVDDDQGALIPIGSTATERLGCL
jgi:plastocyanin